MAGTSPLARSLRAGPLPDWSRFWAGRVEVSCAMAFISFLPGTTAATGGDAQLGALIAEGRIDVVVFFWDPLTAQPHDVDVKMLLRLAVLHDIPIACNRSSADYLVSSPLFAIPEKYREDRNRAGPNYAPWAR